MTGEPSDPLWQNSRALAAERLPTYVFFDGDCAACHQVVRYLLYHKLRERFRFVPLTQLADFVAAESWSDCGVGPHSDQSSVVVLKNGVVLIKGRAVIAVLSELGIFWRLACVKWRLLLPQRFVDFCYDLFANLRIKLFGRADLGAMCELLPPEQRRLIINKATSEKLPIFQRRTGAFLSAQWVNLVIINYKVPAEILLPFIPHGLELDDWQGEHLVSLVAFSFLNTSMSDVTVPMYDNFEEVNLRFYVKKNVDTASGPETRRGVMFIKELVPYRFITFIANIGYGENYHHARTNHYARGQNHGAGFIFGYRFTEAHGSFEDAVSIKVETQGPPQAMLPSSLAEFITEHYFGYVKNKGNTATEYEVQHPRWQVWQNPSIAIAGDISRFYPGAFAPYLGNPHSMVASPGSVIRVFRGHKLAPQK